MTNTATKSKTHTIQGKASWLKILGEPVGGYPNGTGPKEWTGDIILDDKAIKSYLKSGGSDFYIKENKEGQKYLRFVRKAIKRDGTPGKPFSVVDHANRPWPQDVLIGNGSVINVAYTLNEVGFGKEKRLKPSALAIQVWNHVPYDATKGGSVFPTRNDIDDVTPSEEW